MENKGFQFLGNGKHLDHNCREGMCPVWYPQDTHLGYHIKSFEIWTCIYCHERAPDYMIVQWKLLNELFNK